MKNEKDILAALRFSEIRYRRLFETAQDGILLLNAGTGQIEDANPFLMDMLGYSREELLGKKLWEIGFIKDAGIARRAFEELQKNEYIRYEDLPLETKDGHGIAVEFVSNVYGFNGDKVIQCNIRDITARKLLEQQREDFYAMVTHDIKSPLTTILAFAELLQADEKYNLETDALEIVATIEQSGKRLLRIVEDFLSLSRLESGRMTLAKTMVDVTGLLEGVFEEYKPRASEKDLEFNLEPAGDRILCLLDKRFLELAVINLVQNSVNYTQSGGVNLKAERQTANGREYIVISVSDTGPGIPKEYIDKIFNKYYRSPVFAAIKGTGLGLAIVKAVAEAHGGEAEVDCPDGGGCTFRLVLPVG